MMVSEWPTDDGAPPSYMVAFLPLCVSLVRGGERGVGDCVSDQELGESKELAL